jgi:hypothetical protein
MHPVIRAGLETALGGGLAAPRIVTSALFALAHGVATDRTGALRDLATRWLGA